MRAVAITDHGNMFGAKEFHIEATRRGIKPILGCEAYIANRSRHSKKDKNQDGFDHVVLLAKNYKGYQNLITIVSLGWTEGFYYKPRIDRELLEKYKEGVKRLDDDKLQGWLEEHTLGELWERNIINSAQPFSK